MNFKFKTPKEGDKRVKEFFTWLPYKVGNEVRWMEKVRILQEYRLTRAMNTKLVINVAWVSIRFIEISESYKPDFDNVGTAPKGD
jgi:hypothetical protein